MHQSLRTTVCISVLLTTAAACSPTIHQHKVAQIRSAAIVGFDAQLPATGHASQSAIRADQAYDQLALSLGTSLGWKITERTELTSHPLYAASYEHHIQNAPLGTLGQTMARLSDDYYPSGIMWSRHAQGLTESERLALMDVLKIDALAIAHIDVQPCSEHATEFESSAADQARLSFEVYDRTTAEPIWADRWVVGEPSQSIPTSDPSKLNASYLEAIEQAYITLFERYQAQE